MTVNGKTEYWGNSYGYDAWGNLTEKTPTKCSAENLTVTALTNNQLSGYGYDAAGNMTHDSTTGNNYTYDSENRITGAAGYAYTYDADGNRVEKSNGSTGTIYWYTSPGIIAESDLSGNLKSEYVFFNGRRTARKDFPSGAISCYFSDHLGTASVITDSAGNIKEDEDYYPWGGELKISAADSGNHYKFTGKERDSETGLDLMGARYYSNPLGRFVTPDPLMIQKQKLFDPQQWNMYQYARDNPLRFVDPTGKYTTSCTSSDVSKCDQNTQNFEKARQAALQSSDKKVVAAAKAYGAYGEKNNVAVGFQNKEASSVTFATNSKGAVTGIDVSINTKTLSGITQEKDSQGETTIGFARAVADVAHEGSHVQTDQALINHNMDPAYNVTNRQSEHPAYKITDSVLRSYGWAGTDPKGNMLDLSKDDVIDKFLDSIPPEGQEKLDDPIYKPPN